MTTAIKEYKELIEIVVYPNKPHEEVYFFPKDSYEALKSEIRGESHVEVAPMTLVNKFDVRTRTRKATQVDNMIFALDQDLRDKVQKHIRRVWQEHKRKIDTPEALQTVIEHCSI